MKYELISELSRCEIEEAIARDDRERLQAAVLSAALHSSDPEWAESICVELARHDHPGIRGNAILGFGHIARLHGRLTERLVKPVIETALGDSDEYVKSNAISAADDVEFFLKWRCRRLE
jgi:hypothetical protein